VNDTAEAMCYVYDANGHMRDLNPLIKTRSFHQVVTGDDSEMFINVCRDIPQGVYYSSAVIIFSMIYDDLLSVFVITWCLRWQTVV